HSAGFGKISCKKATKALTVGLPRRLSDQSAVMLCRSAQYCVRTGTSSPRATYGAATYVGERPIPAPPATAAVTASELSTTTPAAGRISTVRLPTRNGQRNNCPVL